MHAVLKPTVDFELEWHLSARWAIVALLLAAVVMLVASDDVLDLGRRARIDLLGTLLYPLSGVAWLLEFWKPRVGRAATTVLLIVVVVAIRGWLGVPGTLALLSVPTGVAVAMLGPAAAVLAAVGESGLLLLLLHPFMPLPSFLPLASVDGSEISVALVAVWSSLAVAYAVYRPLSQLDRRLWESLRQAQGRMDESLDRKVELAQALEDLGNANRQLALANERLAALRAVAEEAQRSKAAFVARVSHEFRTPLNMIIGLVGIMVENPEVYAEGLPPDLWVDLEIVYRNCQHLSGMINDVLDLTQAEAGRLVLHREQVDLRAIVESAIAVVRPMIDKKRLALQISVPDDLPQVYCDPHRVRQVLLNLLSNAARFTAQGGIKVVAMRQNRHVVIEVADTGPGISQEEMGRVFEPFYGEQVRLGADRSLRDNTGSGLGLSISKQFVHLHGGRMWLESQVGVGTSFCFTLPSCPPQEPVARPDRWIKEDWVWREHAFQTSQSYSTGQLLKPRIVVCDQTSALRPELARYADEVEFVDVCDLSQAMQVLQTCPAHAVMLNAPTPDDLLAPSLLQAPVLGGVPPLLLHAGTLIIGCSIPRLVSRAQELGAVGHLVKPVTRADLEGVIRTLGQPVRRVLLVDDEPEVLQLWTRMLHLSDPALQVVTAGDGWQALAELERERPDLVLLDLVLPGLDGWQVLERMAREDAAQGIPVVVVSAQDPHAQQPVSPFLVAAIGEGFSSARLVRCSLGLASILLRPDPEPG